MQLKISAAAVMEEEVRATRRRVAPFAVLAKPLFGVGVPPAPSRCVMHAGSGTRRRKVLLDRKLRRRRSRVRRLVTR
uniref:Uncharacterized protein n=1 Tax=Brassica campestris TaxID=3711 RepID=A0A3P5ZBU0_BRACM|nr:unnamed protein product [Brassica rapa]